MTPIERIGPRLAGVLLGGLAPLLLWVGGFVGLAMLYAEPAFAGDEAGAQVGFVVFCLLVVGAVVLLCWLGARMLRAAGSSRPAVASVLAVVAPTGVGALLADLSSSVWQFALALCTLGAVIGGIAAGGGNRRRATSR
jgi:hypothetical protein